MGEEKQPITRKRINKIRLHKGGGGGGVAPPRLYAHPTMGNPEDVDRALNESPKKAVIKTRLHHSSPQDPC